MRALNQLRSLLESVDHWNDGRLRRWFKWWQRRRAKTKQAAAATGEIEALCQELAVAVAARESRAPLRAGGRPTAVSLVVLCVDRLLAQCAFRGACAAAPNRCALVLGRAAGSDTDTLDGNQLARSHTRTVVARNVWSVLRGGRTAQNDAAQISRQLQDDSPEMGCKPLKVRQNQQVFASLTA